MNRRSTKIFVDYFPVLYFPSCKLLDVFQETTSPMFERIDQNEHNSKVLATLRDTLLPKLLSGEVAVTPDA